MDIEQKTKIFLDVLKISYFKQKPLDQGYLKISNTMIESAGLNLEEVFNLICPYLENKGYLISYSSLIRGGKDWNNLTKIEEANLNSKKMDLIYFFKINEDNINKDLKKMKEEEEENILVTNKKRTTLPKFQRTDWSKVSIKFIDERNFVLSNSIETKPCIPESLGCLDNRNQKPDGAWKFLLKVANGNGITNSIGKKEREKQKKHKQRATDILRMIFNDDTDPFEKEKGGVYKAKFRIGFTEDDSPKTKGKREYLDLDEVRKEMTGE